MSTPFTLFPNDFTIGKDVSGRIYDDSGLSRNLAEIGHLLMLHVRATEEIIRSRPISNGGVVLYETIWEGVEVDLRFTRARRNVEFITLQAMNNFFNQDLRPNFYLAWNVLNRDGTTDGFLAQGLKIATPDLGSFQSNRDVEQALRFMGQKGTFTGPNQPQVGASPLSF